MYTSPAQIEANRANAQHSTSPRTAEGKSGSSANATKLGLYATRAALLMPQDLASTRSFPETKRSPATGGTQFPQIPQGFMSLASSTPRAAAKP